MNVFLFSSTYIDYTIISESNGPQSQCAHFLLPETWGLELQDLGIASWETYMQVKKQQLELDMEQQIGSK